MTRKKEFTETIADVRHRNKGKRIRNKLMSLLAKLGIESAERHLPVRVFWA